jgi:hypothetical protein
MTTAEMQNLAAMAYKLMMRSTSIKFLKVRTDTQTL